MVREIKLTQGKFATIDDEDYASVAGLKWCADKSRHTYYAVSNARVNGKYKTILLHRFLTNAPKGLQVDHINGDGLDCTRANLRVCTNAENHRNRRVYANNTSGFKGVYWHKSHAKWMSYIRIDGRTIYLGYFTDKEQAALAYNAASLVYHKEFASLNKI